MGREGLLCIQHLQHNLFPSSKWQQQFYFVLLLLNRVSSTFFILTRCYSLELAFVLGSAQESLCAKAVCLCKNLESIFCSQTTDHYWILGWIMRIKLPAADNCQADSKRKMESHCACVCVFMCVRACVAFSCQSSPVSWERTIMKPVRSPLSLHLSRRDTVGSAASGEDKRHAEAAQQKQSDVGRCRTYSASAACSSPWSSSWMTPTHERCEIMAGSFPGRSLREPFSVSGQTVSNALLPWK